jgi:Histidine kinase-, DNA gyrase B-, and HSP90-like ATPase
LDFFRAVREESSTPGAYMSSTQAEFTFSPRILEHLGISAYNSVRKCLAEIVANAYDADAKHVWIHLPDVIDENAAITLSDDGAGMSVEDLKTKFLYIGRDRREDGDRTASARLVIGSKGIGKLAGFGIASRIRLTTRRDGKQSSITIDRADLDSIQQLSGHLFNITVSDTEAENGTTIELLELHEGLHLPPADVVRRHLKRTMPSRPDFQMYVNDIECTAEDVLGTKSDFKATIPGVGDVTGYYIVANQRQPDPGLAVRVRDRIVQEPSLFGLDTRTHGFFTAEKIVGEINAEFLDPEASDGERHDLIKTSRDGFLEDSDIVQKFNEWASTFIRSVVQGVDEGETKKRTDALMSSTEVQARLGALPPHIRGTASRVVRAIIAKLKTASDEDAKNLIEWILRYYESNVLKELMNAIAAADIHEAEKLAGLVNEWGLTQLNSVAGIVRTQISIISRLEELISSNKAYEIDLHKLVESNLWLVKEGLELWSSDKPLKAVLDGRVDELYKDKEDLRPDLICRSRDEGKQAIILEFKRPKEKITMEHVTQALEYEGLINKHRPNIEFVTYVVGREYDPAVLAIREKQANAGLHLWSFEEILQKARARFEKILDILGR